MVSDGGGETPLALTMLGLDGGVFFLSFGQMQAPLPYWMLNWRPQAQLLEQIVQIKPGYVWLLLE